MAVFADLGFFAAEVSSPASVTAPFTASPLEASSVNVSRTDAMAAVERACALGRGRLTKFPATRKATAPMECTAGGQGDDMDVEDVSSFDDRCGGARCAGGRRFEEKRRLNMSERKTT